MGHYASGGTADITHAVVWQSINKQVATIDSAGLATGLLANATCVFASLHEITSDPIALTVIGPDTLLSIDVTPGSCDLASGALQQFVARGTYLTGGVHDISEMVHWSVADPAVASINALGLLAALLPGASSVSASLAGVTSAAVPVTVHDELVSLVVTPAAPGMFSGSASTLIEFAGKPPCDLQFIATGVYESGLKKDLTCQVGWSNTDRGVGTVNAYGLMDLRLPVPTLVAVVATRGLVAGSFRFLSIKIKSI